MKKIFAIIVFFLCIINVNALEINSKNAILYNLNDNTIIYEKGKSDITKIASLTKIMTTIVAIEKIDNLDKEITMTNEMFKGLIEENAYQIGLKVGDTVTYRDLLYGTFIASGADATRGLTMTLTTKEDEYVQLMNKKAQEIGLKNTVFTNPIGLDEEGQRSTVEDVAKMLMYALKNETFKKIIETKTYSIGNITVQSSLHSTGKKFGIDTSQIIGGKTGYTLDAGRCLASIATDKTNNIDYLLVTTNANNTPEHVMDAYNIYNYYFENYKYHTILKNNTLIKTIKVKYAKTKELKIYNDKEITKYLDNTFNYDNIELKYKGKEIIDYKTKKGDKLGKVEIIYNDKVLDKIDVYSNEDIKFSLISYIFDNTLRRILFIGSIVLIIIIAIKKKVS